MSWNGHHVLALVPARSGSKGVPDKNLQALGDRSLIAWAGEVLSQATFVDARIDPDGLAGIRGGGPASRA